MFYDFICRTIDSFKEGLSSNLLSFIPRTVPPAEREPLAIRLLTLSRILHLWIKKIITSSGSSVEATFYVDGSCTFDLQLQRNQIYDLFVASLSEEERHFFAPMRGKIEQLVEAYAARVGTLFQIAKRLIVEEIDQFKDLIAQLKVPNRYVFLLMLKTLARDVKRKLADYLFSNYVGIQPALLEQLAEVLLQHFDMDSHGQTRSDSKQDRLQKIVSGMGILQVQKLFCEPKVNQEGQSGYTLTIIHKDESGQNSSTTLFVKDEELQQQEIRVTATSSNIKRIVKMKDKVLDQASSLPATAEMSLVSGIGTIGGSLGKCLAKINRYGRKREFLLEFGKETAVGGMITVLVEQIPGAGLILASSGFGILLGQTFTSEEWTLETKLMRLGSVALRTGSRLAAGTTGAIVGQAAIPVPILGAFIGGLVGGLMGGVISETVQGVRARGLKKEINLIESRINSEGFWDDFSILAEIGLTTQYFLNSIPPYIGRKPTPQVYWLTILCFNVVSACKSIEMASCSQQEATCQPMNQFEQAVLQGVPISLVMCQKFLEQEGVDLRLCQLQAQPLLIAALSILL